MKPVVSRLWQVCVPVAAALGLIFACPSDDGWTAHSLRLARAGRLTILPSYSDTPQASGRRSGESYDLLIVNGRIVDGSGRAGLQADLGIRGGRIVRIGSLAGEPARETIDARGLVVAPGFIDAHTHIEAQIEGVRTRLVADNFVLQGVTTVITGNCGRSAADVAALFRKLERMKLGVNVATLVGHNTIRQEVCGSRSKPSPQQLTRMESLVKAALDAGALGFSTGLCYKPGLFAGEDEVVALVAVAARVKAVYATHLRDEAAGEPAALEEAVRTAQRAGIAKLHISHFKAAGRSQWGKAQARLEWVRHAAGPNVRFTSDMYPYTSLSSTLEYLIPAEAFPWLGSALGSSGPGGLGTSNAQNFERALDATLDKLHREGWQDYSNVRVAFSERHKEWIGRTVPEIVRAEQGGAAASPRDQVAWILRNQRRGDVQIIAEEMSDQDVRQLMQAPEMCVGSDSSIHYRGLGRPHPRGAGTFPRIFAEYVRELKILPLEEAVRRATSLPAAIFALPERGLVREGCWADLVLFDPARIQDRATANDPWKPPEGIPFVIENGVVVARKGKPTGLLAGRPLRRSGTGQSTASN